MGHLRPEADGVDLANHLGDREGRDKADLALLAGGAERHAGQVIRVLGRTKVLTHVAGGLGPGRLLELDVGVLLGFGVHRVLEAEGRPEDDLVAIADQIFDDLGDLGTFRNVFFERGLHRAAELLLDILAALVMSLGPAVIRRRSHVNPGRLDRRAAAAGSRGAIPAAARADAQRSQHRQGDVNGFLHVLLSLP